MKTLYRLFTISDEPESFGELLFVSDSKQEVLDRISKLDRVSMDCLYFSKKEIDWATAQAKEKYRSYNNTDCALDPMDKFLLGFPESLR